MTDLDDLTSIKVNFGSVKAVTVDGIEGEFGFVTEDMTEKEFAEAAKNISMISRIRIDKTVFFIIHSKCTILLCKNKIL